MHVNAAAPSPHASATSDGPRLSRWEEVRLDLRRRILCLDLSPGAPLTELGIAREYGISPTPARDALGRLHQEGFVTAGPGRRYTVARLSIADVAELAEIRFVLESGICRLAIDRADADGLARVRASAARIEEPDLGRPELIDRNQDFHLAVAGLTGNQLLVAELRRVLEDSRRVFHLGMNLLSVSEMVSAHGRLVAAIESGDLVTALDVCEEEALGTSERVVWQLVRGGTSAGRHLDASTAGDGARSR